MDEETRLDIEFQNEVLAEKQKQREAWRTYAAAAFATMDGGKWTEIGMIRAATSTADKMLAEENKRFGGDL